MTEPIEFKYSKLVLERIYGGGYLVREEYQLDMPVNIILACSSIDEALDFLKEEIAYGRSN